MILSLPKSAVTPFIQCGNLKSGHIKTMTTCSSSSRTQTRVGFVTLGPSPLMTMAGFSSRTAPLSTQPSRPKLVPGQPHCLMAQGPVTPPSSLDLNPLNFGVWGILEAKTCATSNKNLDQLKA